MQIETIIEPVTEITNIKQQEAIVAEKVEKTIKTENQAVIKKNDNEKLLELQKSLAEQNIALRFSKDAETNILIVEMVDDATGKAILQLPSKVSLKLAAESAKPEGLFVNKTV